MAKPNPLFQKQHLMDRRSFLKLSGLLGLGMTSFGILPPRAEAVKFNPNTYKVTDSKVAMGTYVSMTLFHASRDRAEEAMGRAFDEIERLVGLMNRFDRNTAVAQLNSEGTLKDVPPEVAEVIRRSLDYYRITQGLFDITVKPIIDLFQKNFSEGKNSPPEDGLLNKALKLVGSDKIELKDRTIQFRETGMEITLDGIAKGYIVDRASELLRQHQIKDHLINAGGDIRASGSNPCKKSWSIAIEDPEKERHYPDIVQLTDGAMATSGNYEVYFDQEKMFHHIVNPRTGLSPELSASVSVLADTAMNADALATSVFVMSPSAGLSFVNALPNRECLVVAKTGQTFKSPGWKRAAR